MSRAQRYSNLRRAKVHGPELIEAPGWLLISDFVGKQRDAINFSSQAKSWYPGHVVIADVLLRFPGGGALLEVGPLPSDHSACGSFPSVVASCWSSRANAGANRITHMNTTEHRRQDPEGATVRSPAPSTDQPKLIPPMASLPGLRGRGRCGWFEEPQRLNRCNRGGDQCGRCGRKISGL